MADITGLPLFDRVVIVGLSQILVAALLALLTINLYLRFRKRRLAATKYLTLVSLFLALTACMQIIVAIFIEQIFAIIGFGWGLAFGLSAIANIFLYVFMLEIFSEGRKSGGAWFTVFVVVEAAVAVLMPILSPLGNAIPVFEPLLLMVLVTHLVFAFALYITLARVTTASIRKTTDPLARKGFSLIRLASFAIIVAYCFFVFDRIWSDLFEPESYTVWVIVAWIMAGIGGLLLYSGFIMPSRIRGTTKS